ncbi:MAG: tRNA (guanosine(37)-N1)-methyltransferase TrmD [Pseudomonadota bacterium]
MGEKVRAEAFCAKVLTLFPDLFPGPLAASLTGKALDQGLWSLQALDIRRFATDKHRVVDDTPAGGGPGLVMRADVVSAAIRSAQMGCPLDRGRWPVIYLSPRGRPFTQARARAIAAGDGVTLLCGRFEGVDQRVLDAHDVEEVTLGDAVLTGGEIPAMALLDAVVRLRPGVLGNQASTEDESFSKGLLEHPHYTRPQIWGGRTIPEVLLSGHHGRISAWRQAEAEKITQERRPDLWKAYQAELRSPEQSDANEPPDQGGEQED